MSILWNDIGVQRYGTAVLEVSCGSLRNPRWAGVNVLPRRHVFRDLRPYICTFKHCNDAEKLFSSRHEWKHHEFQIHRREYVCQRCKSRCISRSEMSMHLQQHYGDSIPSAQMDIILDLCDRQVDPSNEDTEPCILCEEEVSLPAWHEHVAGHMENLSLFVLPAPENDNDETQGSITSGKADVLGSKVESIEYASTASSLGFSRTEDHDQDQAKFKEYFASKEVEYKSRLSAWGVPDEDNTFLPSTETQAKTDLESPGEKFQALRKTLGQGILNANTEHTLTRMSNIISNHKIYEMTPAEYQRLTRMQVDLVQLNKTLLGEMHASTLTSMLSLASTYRNQGRWEEAESLQKQVVEAREMILGAEHPDTLTGIANLALTYHKQSRWNEAEPLQKQVMEARERVLGVDHPDTVSSKTDLISTYRNQHRLEEAAAIYNRL